MKKRIFCLLIITAFMFCSCNSKSQNMEQIKKDAEQKVQMAENMEELEDYIGDYIIGKLISLPRVGLMESKYAEAETDIPGRKLAIRNDGVEFDGDFFECGEIVECDHELTARMHNVGGINAVNLCGMNEIVKAFFFFDVDEDKRIDLILGEDGKLKLWVTEPYLYIGGYEVIPQ